MQRNVFARLLERVASVPHRSVSALSYGEWFTLYVQALKSARNDSGVQWCNTKLNAARRSVDIAFLSSVVSQKWTDVILPESDGRVQMPGWCQEESGMTAAAEWLHPSSTIYGREVVTASFLLEPLLSGRAITAWTEAVQQAFVAPGEAQDGAKGKKTLLVVVPFTTLFQLRCEAHPRNRDPSTNMEPRRKLLTMQERSACFSVLQSLRYLMEMQNSGKCTAEVRLMVWSPVNEFDAIMQGPQVRMSLPEPLRPHFSMTQLCEDETVRTAYLGHYLRFATKEGRPTILAPQKQHAALRQLGVMSTCDKTMLVCRKETQSLAGTPTNNSLHRRAVNSCSKLARRMSAREENLRHILIP